MDNVDLKSILSKLKASNDDREKTLDEIQEERARQNIIDAREELAKLSLQKTIPMSNLENVSPRKGMVVQQKLTPAVLGAPTGILDPAFYVEATENMLIACNHLALTSNVELKRLGYDSSRGLLSWDLFSEDSRDKFKLATGLLGEIISNEFAPQNQIIWLNKAGETNMNRDFILQKLIPIDIKSHVVDPNTNSKHPSGATLTERDTKSMAGVLAQYDLIQEGIHIRAVRIGWLTNESALAAIQHSRDTNSRERALKAPGFEERKANESGKPYAPENQRYKITRAGMSQKDELIAYLRTRVGFTQNSPAPRTVIEWLMVNGRVTKRGDEYRLQLITSETHHVKGNLALPLKDPFGKSGFIAVSRSEKGGPKHRFQLPDSVRDLHIGSFNIDAQEVINALAKVGKLIVIS
jgi:hypothetical protein